MAYFNTCPRCGAHLDPGERCTCGGSEGEKHRKSSTQKSPAGVMTTNPQNGKKPGNSSEQLKI